MPQNRVKNTKKRQRVVKRNRDLNSKKRRRVSNSKLKRNSKKNKQKGGNQESVKNIMIQNLCTSTKRRKFKKQR